jgi:hypothetical protein
MNGARKATPPNDAILNPAQVGRGDSAAAGRGARGGEIIFCFSLDRFFLAEEKGNSSPGSCRLRRVR